MLQDSAAPWHPYSRSIKVDLGNVALILKPENTHTYKSLAIRAGIKGSSPLQVYTKLTAA